MSNPLIESATHCFACGPDNPIGLKIVFTLEDDGCSGHFTPDANHVGYADTVHGGIIFSALDDVMANALYLKGIKAHTARCEIRYRQALSVGQPVTLRSWITNERRRLIVLKAEARRNSDDKVIADCEASFMVE